jgi:hypothetical protein
MFMMSGVSARTLRAALGVTRNMGMPAAKPAEKTAPRPRRIVRWPAAAMFRNGWRTREFCSNN